MAPRQ